MKGFVISPSDSRWWEVLTHVDHDVYHLPGYAAVEAERLGGEPVAILIEDRCGFLFLPLIVRPLPEDLGLGDAGYRDAVSPYGYPGPLLSASARGNATFYPRAAEALVRQLREIGVCSTLVRQHPLLSAPKELTDAVGNLREVGPTVWIDLSLPPEDLTRQTRATTRNLVRKTERAGYRASVDVEWSCLSDFVRLYQATMERVGADTQYYFKEGYFWALQTALGDRLHLSVVQREDRTVAAGLFTESCGIVQYHLSGMEDPLDGSSPTRLMLVHMRAWAKERGNRVFHLGGGLGSKEDSLYEFKTGFSHLRSKFSVWEIVTDTARYRAACDAGRRLHPHPAAADSSYFPQYRRP
jgi:hypothetical protein